MSREFFEDGDPGNRPAMIDPATGKVYPEHHPVMRAVINVWNTQTTIEDREAWFLFCVKNSREPGVMVRAQALSKKIEAALASLN